MTKVIKSKFKVSRRLSVSIWGDSKDAFNKKNYKPGMHVSIGNKISDYGLHLRAKQRLKNHYGRITEKQFRNLFKTALIKKGNTSENFIGLLESRVDVIVYRMNFAPSIFTARQLVSHGHVLVNGKKINIPSYKLKISDTVSIKDSSKTIPIILSSLNQSKVVPTYLSCDVDKMSGILVQYPALSDVPFPFVPDMNLIIEWYSR